MLRSLFPCQHRNMSRVWTPDGRPEDSYVVCLDCAGRFAYDLGSMRIGLKIEVQPVRPMKAEAASNVG